MPLIDIVIYLLVLGVLLWVVNYIPYIAPPIKQIINIVVIVAAVLWLASLFLPMGRFGAIRVGHG